MPDGEYLLGSETVYVANGHVATADGVLAENILPLDRAVANFIRFTGATLEQALRLVTANPAAMTGLDKETGALVVGRAANLVALDGSGMLMGSMVGGEAVAG